MDNLPIHIQALVMEQEVIIHQVVPTVDILIIPTVQVQCTVQIIMVVVLVVVVLVVLVVLVLVVLVVLVATEDMDKIRTIHTVVSDLVIFYFNTT
jgi:hypothetical protein